MDLFPVNRYYLEEDEEVSKCTSEKERQQLNSLNERIRKRKSGQLKKNDFPDFKSNDISHGNNEEQPKPKKKKKKKKRDHDSEDEEEILITKEVKEVISLKKRDKKIKKSKNQNSSFELGEEHLANQIFDDIEQDSKDLQTEEKKKKKTKKVGKKESVENCNNKEVFDSRDNKDINANSYSNTDEIFDINDDSQKSFITSRVPTDPQPSVGIDEMDHENERNENTDNTPYFPILGSENKKKEKQIVKRTLPKWISHPRLLMADISKGKVSLDDIDMLSEFFKARLRENAIEHLFPVQAVVIPYILSQQVNGTIYGKGGLMPSDICVSAPTGSGKTLTYVLPIIQILSKCFVRRLQAIIILPSKDLAAQIKVVISNYVKGTQVRVGLASGMKSFQHEQEQLVTSGPDGMATSVDILVCTPGRLVDHIDHTAGFSLEHLRFLIIDEADRLLGQAYHNWLEKIFQAAYRSRSDASANRNIATFRSRTPFLTPASLDRIELPLQKLLFSATMTQNPEKLAPLQLFRPVLFTSAEKGAVDGASNRSDVNEDEASNERFILPESLTEKMSVCKQGEKPLVVIYLMKKLEYTRALCFTGSIDTTHRLFLLVKACGIRAAEFSSTLNQSQRKGILRDFKSGKIDLLICSDAMSRGMDIDNVQYVISYDPPVNIKTYVHRVGRTARAGQQGMALTILYPKEAYHFKKIIRNGKRSTLQKLNIISADFEPLVGEYERALISLKDTVEAERSQGFQRNK